jgi:hypothetical protein
MNEVDDLNDYSSDQFSINERVSYFMEGQQLRQTLMGLLNLST